jgi:hypothetical protein
MPTDQTERLYYYFVKRTLLGGAWYVFFRETVTGREILTAKFYAARDANEYVEHMNEGTEKSDWLQEGVAYYPSPEYVLSKKKE